MKKAKVKTKTIFLLLAGLAAVFLLPLALFWFLDSYMWDSQIAATPYKIAFEKDARLYESDIQSAALAFDNGTGDDHLYLNTFSYLGDLLAISYGDFQIVQTDNPFFAGKMKSNGGKKFFEQQTKYINPKDSYQAYIFCDQNRNQIFVYEANVPNEFVSELVPRMPSFFEGSYKTGSREYVDATRLLKEKINKTLKIKADDTNKLLILSFE